MLKSRHADCSYEVGLVTPGVPGFVLFLLIFFTPPSLTALVGLFPLLILPFFRSLVLIAGSAGVGVALALVLSASFSFNFCAAFEASVAWTFSC